jgi:hypothetical protein
MFRKGFRPVMIERPVGAAARRSLDAMVRQVADLSVDAVSRLVADRVTKMTVSEARGYTRARAAKEIRRQTRLILPQHVAADADWQRAVIVRATDRVAPLVLRQLATERIRQAELRLFGATTQRRAA